MSKDPIVMRNTSSEIQAQLNAENSPLARIAKYDDYPGIDIPPIAAPLISGYTRGYIIGTGIPGASIIPYVNLVAQAAFLVGVNGRWSIQVARGTVDKSYSFTQSANGQTSGFLTSIIIPAL
jgi:hypothetical protein